MSYLSPNTTERAVWLTKTLRRHTLRVRSTLFFDLSAPHRSPASRRSWKGESASTEGTTETEDEVAVIEKALVSEGAAEARVVTPVENAPPRGVIWRRRRER